MNRRMLLKLTGLAAVAGAVVTLPRAAGRRPGTAAPMSSGAWLTVPEPGLYRISGRVRLDAPQVEISGITNTQRISWSAPGGPERPVASFTTFEHFDGPGFPREIQVRGGHLESVTAVPVDFA